MKAYKMTHNNMTIRIGEPTVKAVRAALSDFMFQILVPDENLREDMIATFSKKLEAGDYEVVDVKEDDKNE